MRNRCGGILNSGHRQVNAWKYRFLVARIGRNASGIPLSYDQDRDELSGKGEKHYVKTLCM